MKKMPCVFVRDFKGRDFTITSEVTPGCEWVLAGEGVPTRKRDGTACAVIGGRLHARYDAKRGKRAPADAVPCDPSPDPVTGHWPHWVPVYEQPHFKYHRIAQEALFDAARELADGTYELVGPAVNANPEGRSELELVRHGSDVLEGAPRDFDGLREYLGTFNGEGIVFHHPDGRMAKLRRHDFGFAWPVEVTR